MEKESQSIFKLDKSKVKDEWSGMPSDDIDPKNKKGDWCLKWAQFIYSMFYNNQCYTTWDKIQEYRLLRLYGAGQQPREFYMQWLLGDKDQKTGLRTGYMNVDWDVWSPAPKFKKIVLGRFESQDHKISANAIDKLSGADREKEKWNSWYESEFGKKESEIKSKLKIVEPDKVKYVPETLDELEMYSQMGGFKMTKEIDIEKALSYTDYISNSKNIKRKLISDAFDINIMAFRDVFDIIQKKVVYEYMDPEYAVFDYSKEEDFSDMRFWGYQKLYSIKRLRIESGLSEDKLRAHALLFAGNFGNPDARMINDFSLNNYKNKDGVFVYDMYKVPVWYTEWASVDKKYKTKRKTPMGEVVFDSEYGKVWDTDKRKTEIKESQNVYTCCWIIGSEDVFSDGQLDLVPRDENKAVKMTAHVVALTGQSIVKSIKSSLDQLQLNNLKLQNALAEAAPSGLKIEFGALNNINLGDGDMSPLELIKLYRQSGNVIYKATTHAGKYNNYAQPIETLTGGIGSSLDEFIKIFELHFQLIAELSGIDRISAVSPKQGEPGTAEEAKLSGAATTDALQPLFAAYIDIKERAARNAAYRIQTIIKYVPGAYDVYYPVMGKASMEELKLSLDVTAAYYGIKIEALPTEQEKRDIMLAATEALKPGKDGENISFGEYLLIAQMVNMGQLKQATAILNFRLSKRKKEALQLQQENMRLNGENAVQIEARKEEKELKVIAAKADAQIKLELLKAFLMKDSSQDEHLRDMQKMIIEKYIDVKAQQMMPSQPGETVAA